MLKHKNLFIFLLEHDIVVDDNGSSNNGSKFVKKNIYVYKIL